MKYGVIGFSHLRDDRKFVNVGDWFQSLAIIEQYKKMNVNDDDIVIIDINKLNTYDGEYIILPININLSYNWIIDIFPLSPRIIPIFIGLSYFTASKLPDKLVSYFKEFSPIGCRDESTLKLMQSYGIRSYLYGCITLTLPPRFKKNGKKIYMVDTPKSLQKYIPKAILEYEIEYRSHIIIDENNNSYNKSKELLKEYAENAQLIITSRMHCIAPCIAMNIPVIATVDNCSPRFGGLDKFIQIYTPDKFDIIDWSPKVAKINSQKKIMENHFQKTINHIITQYESILDYSYYLETRKKSNYGNYYKNTLRKIPYNNYDKFDYVIWGTGQIGISVYQAMKNLYPNSNLVMAVDSYCNGEFFGLEIEKPNKILKYKNVYVLIASYSGEKEITRFLKNYDYREIKNYIKLGTKTG